MALVVYWYDFICFGIIAGAIFGMLWIILKKECPGRSRDGTKYESLLLCRSDDDRFAAPTQSCYVSGRQLWTSCWRGMQPGWLLLFRLTSTVVMVGLLAWDVQTYSADIFVYYTEWTFTLIIVYFVLGTMISAHGCSVYSKEQFMEDAERDRFMRADLEESKAATLTFWKHRIWGNIKLQSHYEKEETEQRAGFWGYLMQIVFQTCAGAVMLTDIVFWCLIVPLSIEHFSLNLLMGCMHTVNVAFLLLDTAINSLSLPWFRMSYFVLWSCLYVIFQWVIHACGYSLWPYPFLELSTPWAPLWYFCLAVIHIPCYGIYYLIVKVKYSTFPKLFPHAFIRSY